MADVGHAAGVSGGVAVPAMAPETKETGFTCETCGKVYTQKRNLKRHAVSHDKNAKRYKCEFDGCTRVFLRADDFNDHKKTHTGEEMMQCPHCPKKFSRAGDLKLHTRRHTRDTRFACQLCAKAFIRKCDLLQHQMRKHTDAQSEATPSPTNPSTSPPLAPSTATPSVHVPEPQPMTSATTSASAPLLPPLTMADVKDRSHATAELARQELCPWSDCSCGLACKCKSACSCGLTPKTDTEWEQLITSLMQHA
eukprot:m.87409 g.87409  ORF g.87409 m.87409 type:complete len:252 (-) comp9700_c0_seq1:159-914(-)